MTNLFLALLSLAFTFAILALVASYGVPALLSVASFSLPVAR